MGNSASSVLETLADRPRVVIIGGGYGGIALAKALDSKFNVLVIEPRRSFFHNIASLRPIVSPSFLPSVFYPYDLVLQHGFVLHGWVTDILANNHVEVKLNIPETSDAELVRVPFDYLVIACGSSPLFPSNAEDLKQVQEEYALCQEKVKEAKHVTIIGAGAVGLELMGEIAQEYPDKKITVLQAADKIITEGVTDAFREDVLRRIKAAFPNVEIRTGEKVELQQVFGDEKEGKGDEEMKNSESCAHRRYYSFGARVLETNKGTKIETEAVFVCIGSKLNSKCYEKFLSGKLADNKRIKVNEFMQVTGFEHIFALGDVADAGPKMAFYAADNGEAPYVAANIMNHYRKVPIDRWKKWKGLPPAMFLTLGSNEGSGLMPIKGILVGRKVVREIKGKDMMASRFSSIMGYRNVPEKLVNPSGKSKRDVESLKRLKQLYFAENEAINEEKLALMIA